MASRHRCLHRPLGSARAVNGCLSNSLPRRWVLVGSAAFTLVVVVLFPTTPFLWMVCLGIVALGSAVYSPTRYAMLPAVANDTGVALPRLNSWIEVGGGARFSAA